MTTILCFTTLFFLCFLYPSSVFADLSSDLAALLALRSAVGRRSNQWKLTDTNKPCSWSGVICTTDNSSVIELRLPGMSLSGVIPPETISNLTGLQALSIGYNSLTGPFPVDISSLVNLRYLYLQSNRFSGPIPEFVFSLTNLVRLNLADNHFSGNISKSFENMTRLGTLYLENNNFSGSIPEWNLPGLVQFNVCNNQLSGPIPKGIANNHPKSAFLGNSLCGQPLNDLCDNGEIYGKKKNDLLVGAIAGIVIGCVLGLWIEIQNGKSCSTEEKGVLGDGFTVIGTAKMIDNGKSFSSVEKDVLGDRLTQKTDNGKSFSSEGQGVLGDGLPVIGTTKGTDNGKSFNGEEKGVLGDGLTVIGTNKKTDNGKSFCSEEKGVLRDRHTIIGTTKRTDNGKSFSSKEKYDLGDRLTVIGTTKRTDNGKSFNSEEKGVLGDRLTGTTKRTDNGKSFSSEEKGILGDRLTVIGTTKRTENGKSFSVEEKGVLGDGLTVFGTTKTPDNGKSFSSEEKAVFGDGFRVIVTTNRTDNDKSFSSEEKGVLGDGLPVIGIRKTTDNGKSFSSKEKGVIGDRITVIGTAKRTDNGKSFSSEEKCVLGDGLTVIDTRKMIEKGKSVNSEEKGVLRDGLAVIGTTKGTRNGKPFSSVEKCVLGDGVTVIGTAKRTDKEKNICAQKIIVFVGKTDRVFNLEDLLMGAAKVLGKGTFGTVYKDDLDVGITVAVNRLKDVCVNENVFRGIMDEIGGMNHENLVPLIAYYYNTDEKLLVYDYLPMGSLSALLHGNEGATRTPLTWESRIAIALGAAKGISYLHSKSPTFSHGNIKSSNILLTKTYESRVSESGLARLIGPSASRNHNAGGYKAPEVTDHRKVSQKADVYSFGVLLLELLTGKDPTNTVLNEKGFDLPRWVMSVIREEWTPEVFDFELLRYKSVDEELVQLLLLAFECITTYPDKRPAIGEVVTRIQELYRSSAQKDFTVDDVSC